MFRHVEPPGRLGIVSTSRGWAPMCTYRVSDEIRRTVWSHISVAHFVRTEGSGRLTVVQIAQQRGIWKIDCCANCTTAALPRPLPSSLPRPLPHPLPCPLPRPLPFPLPQTRRTFNYAQTSAQRNGHGHFGSSVLRAHCKALMHWAFAR